MGKIQNEDILKGKYLIGTCKDCEFWVNIFCINDNLTWDSVDYYHFSEDDEPLTGVNLVSRAMGGIQTGKDFGCIHWQQKELT